MARPTSQTDFYTPFNSDVWDEADKLFNNLPKRSHSRPPSRPSSRNSDEDQRSRDFDALMVAVNDKIYANDSEEPNRFHLMTPFELAKWLVFFKNDFARHNNGPQYAITRSTLDSYYNTFPDVFKQMQQLKCTNTDQTTNTCIMEDKSPSVPLNPTLQSDVDNSEVKDCPTVGTQADSRLDNQMCNDCSTQTKNTTALYQTSSKIPSNPFNQTQGSVQELTDILKSVFSGLADQKLLASSTNNQQVITPRIYNGEEDWGDYLLYFNTIIEWNKWNDIQASQSLLLSLKDDAEQFVHSLPRFRSMSFIELCHNLENRFGIENTRLEDDLKLQNRRKMLNESYQHLAQDCARLANRVYRKSRYYADIAAKKAFIRALPKEYRLIVTGNSEHQSLQELVQTVLALENTNDSDARKVREVTLEGNFKPKPDDVGAFQANVSDSKSYNSSMLVQAPNPPTMSLTPAGQMPSSTQNPNRYAFPSTTQMFTGTPNNYVPQYNNASNYYQNRGQNRNNVRGRGRNRGHYNNFNSSNRWNSNQNWNPYTTPPQWDLSRIQCFNCEEYGHMKMYCPYVARKIGPNGVRVGPKILKTSMMPQTQQSVSSQAQPMVPMQAQPTDNNIQTLNVQALPIRQQPQTAQQSQCTLLPQMVLQSSFYDSQQVTVPEFTPGTIYIPPAQQ